MIFTKVDLKRLFVVCSFALNSSTVIAQAITSSDAGICNASAQIASEKTGVPVGVLHAISLTETGRKKSGKFEPWPWTVNMEGKGVWFDNQDDARAYVYKNYKRGARSFDVGCFQLNFKWHGDGFSSIEEMFEPNANAIYAAKFLAKLYQEFGDWSSAAGAYHSRTPKYATKYRKRFNRILASLPADVSGSKPMLLAAKSNSPLQPNAPQNPRQNRFSLLQPGTGISRGLGSLLPISDNFKTIRFIGQSEER